ncbi:cell division protein FtsZ, partial [mine drainage metagenome]
RRATKGLGAGARPEIGEEAARENEEELRAFLNGAHIVFITAGMGGGTGTGSAHLVARLAKEAGALTMGVVTLPFAGEGAARMEQARDGLERLRRVCDTTIVIQNDKLLELVPRMPLDAAFKLADACLMTAIKGITEIVTRPGLVNLDYADILTVMKDGGVALIGLGESESATDRVSEAVTEALTSPLLGSVELNDATGALVRVVGGSHHDRGRGGEGRGPGRIEDLQAGPDHLGLLDRELPRDGEYHQGAPHHHRGPRDQPARPEGRLRLWRVRGSHRPRPLDRRRDEPATSGSK